MIQVLDLPQGRMMKSRSYTSVCWQDFYYAEETGVADDISQEFEAYFKEIEDYFASGIDGIIDDILNYKQINPRQLDQLAWFFACLWVRSPQMRSSVNGMMEKAMKWFGQTVAAEPHFIDDIKQAFDEKGVEASTERIDKMRNMYLDGDYKLEFGNQHHLNTIQKTEEYMLWFKGKNWRFYIAKGSKQFITSDTPVIELTSDDMFNNHIMQRPQFLALTPDVLIELTDPTVGKKFKRKAVGDAEVDEYNLVRAQHSEQFAYAKSRSDLEDLMTYYRGTE